MRGLIRSEQGDHTGARGDLEAAVLGFEAADAGQSPWLAKALGLLAQEYVAHFQDPAAAWPLYQRELTILDAQLDTVVRDEDLRLSWVMATLGLALLSELQDEVPQARRSYEDARAKCDRARLSRTHRLRGMIAEGLARFPARTA